MTEKECPLSAKPQTPAAPPVVLTKIKAGRNPVHRPHKFSVCIHPAQPTYSRIAQNEGTPLFAGELHTFSPLPRAESSRYRRVQWEEAMTEIRLRHSCASQSHRLFSMSDTGMPTSRSVCGTPTSSINEIFHRSSFSITKKGL